MSTHSIPQTERNTSAASYVFERNHRRYLEFSNLSMSSPTFWASFCGCLSPGPGGAPAGLGLGGGGGAGRGLEGGGGILFGFLSCPRASRCAGLGGTEGGGGDKTHNSGGATAARAKEKRGANRRRQILPRQVTRRKLRERSSMAEWQRAARRFPFKRK